MSAMIPFFSSCSDDDSVNEWDMSYVSLLPADYLQPTPSFTLKHVEEEGIEGSVEFQFMATTQKAIAQDINVRYSVTCDGIDADKINLSDKNLVIKGGSTASEPITLSITDWKYLESTKEALDYTLKIKITDIESTSSEVANAAYYQEIILKISKTAEKKKESVEIQGVHIKAAIEEKENTLSSVTKQLEEHKEMNEEISDFRKFETKLHQMKKEIQKQNQNLEQLNQHISVNEQSIRFMDKKMEEYKETEMNYTLLKDLSDTANGEQKGKTKISFERFVQSVYFDLILAAANERLSVMSEQRYYLLRKEENDINKGSSGLELEILDEWTGKRRNVRSLSGGESFKAALSLALGLSDVIQNKKGGIQVDTIFIDEGFGTLDADSLNKAMQIINSLSLEGNKLVGIISHVDELKDQIDQKIEVYKDHAGSKVK